MLPTCIHLPGFERILYFDIVDAYQQFSLPILKSTIVMAGVILYNTTDPGMALILINDREGKGPHMGTLLQSVYTVFAIWFPYPNFGISPN
jgi:hypothetical protein